MGEEYVLTRSTPLTISAEEADKLIALGSGDAALLYLWLLRNGGRFDSDKAARELKTAGGVPAAMALLRGAGLVRGDAPPAVPRQAPVREELQEYTVEEITRISEADKSFRSLLDEAAQRLGRVLSGGDMKIFFNLWHDLGLPTEVILLLVSHCCEEIARRYGAGRKPTMRQIEKEAYIWANRELFSLQLADRYLKERKTKQGRLGEFCELLGIRNRALAPSEERYLLSWMDMGFESDAILLAYDRTVAKKGELAWAYMNRILENWHEKGLHTPAEIRAGDAPPRMKSAAPGSREQGKPAAAEYDRMRDYMKKLEGGGDHGT